MAFLPSAYSDSTDIFSSRLKRIQDALRKFSEEQFQVDELELEDANATSYSLLKYVDKFSFISAPLVTDSDEMPEEPSFTDPRFHFRFDHRGHWLYDQSHHEGHGRVRGNPKFMNGVDWSMFGGEIAWDCDGVNDCLVVNSRENNEIKGLTQFSYVFLIYPKSLALQNGYERCLLSHIEDENSNWASKIEFGTDGKIYFTLRFGTADRKFETSANSITLNNWQWGILTYDEYAGTKCTAYVNGVAKTVITSTHNANIVATDDDDMYIGCTNPFVELDAASPHPNGVVSSVGFYQGGIQDARLYRRVLTQTEATNLNNNKISVSPISIGKVATIGGSAFNE